MKPTQAIKKMEQIKKDHKPDKKFFGGKSAYGLIKNNLNNKNVTIHSEVNDIGEHVAWIEVRSNKLK